ncbi:unnamed protein product [Trifolium pratense]|uniref:Uncharacterized protein n=1 Tax=Trifolium pratense TaxID=57577 RepID=A0ACB0J7D5_TRIPR|nr:unnamed protein product [Trifolium pratense]
MDITEVEEDYIHVSMTIEDNDVCPEDKLKLCTLQGQWEEVEKLYRSHPELCSIDINRSIGTALHAALNDCNNYTVVRNLVDSIIRHNKKEALECKNEKGDTPLHLAASRGFKDICEFIIGKNGERKYLIEIGNNNGESPLFLAALFWRKQTFVYLFNFKPSKSDYDDVDGGKYSYLKGLIRNDGDSILHCAIRKEYFDLALIIVDKYPDLAIISNKHEFSPLKVLATRPSAFISGSKMIWWKRIVYHCLPVGILDVKKAVEYYGTTKQHESSLDNKCPKNYNTCYLFLHKCLEYAYPSSFGDNTEDTKISETLKSETAILAAARNGIIEIVNELITKIPPTIYEVNLENKNVLLVAVENRRTTIVEGLRKRFEESNRMEIFDDLIQGVDKEENTVLHLAATNVTDWNISGAALKMMWHMKWFQYTKGLVPEDYTVRTNKSDKTAGELFKQTYASLIQEGDAWFKDTSESCSVVAALLASVSFATSSTIPGGNNSETGKPTLKGRPAFDAFALSSVIGLSFSVTALILFLSILTSRKEPRDFRIDLPRKLLLGLSSLFLSIVAMFTTFCSGNFFLIDHKFKHFVFLIYSVTCFPVTLYAIAQLPLYTDLLRSIVTNVPERGDKGEDL